ncbi:MAG: TetR/AcrR family transcriptional regulator, partial [Salinibacterium sp.]|nr:TetR/AcrR family transcriptional regulator [Salinibacterium sp.]
RREPGFRALGFGDVIDRRFIQPEKSNNTVLAEAFSDLFEREHGVPPTPELSLDLDVVVELVNALLQRAFLYEKDGDERFLSRLRVIVHDYLASHAVPSTR